MQSITTGKITAFLFFILAILNTPVFGKSADGPNGHKADVFAAFGAGHLNPKSRACLEEIASEFAKYIDDTNYSYSANSKKDVEKILDRVKKVCPNFKTSIDSVNGSRKYLTHRVFFHCGFNKPVETSRGLKKCIQESTSDLHMQREIIKIVQEEQNARNRKMMECVRTALIHTSSNHRINLSHNKINAIAALVYDIHLLGDYIVSSETEEALAPLDTIVADIINAVRKFECPDKKLVKLFEAKVNEAKAQGVKDTGEQGHAYHVLNCLKANLPKIIEETQDVRKALWLY